MINNLKLNLFALAEDTDRLSSRTICSQDALESLFMDCATAIKEIYQVSPHVVQCSVKPQTG
jgi:hypothetical protein